MQSISNSYSLKCSAFVNIFNWLDVYQKASFMTHLFIEREINLYRLLKCIKKRFKFYLHYGMFVRQLYQVKTKGADEKC